MAATDARPVPRKNVAWRLYFAIRKNDGTLITSWTGADSEVSLDGASFADCTNEATEIGTSGCGYLDLTSAEMNADAVAIKITVTNTSALPLVLTVFPEEAGDYRVDVVQFGGTNLTSASGIPEVKVASIATDAVNAAALAANAVTEIQSGLATSTNITDAQTAIIAQIDANETKIDSIQSDTNDIQTRLPAALVGGKMDSTAVLDSASVTAVQSGLATSSALTTVGNNVTAILEDTGTTIPAQISGLNNLSSAQVVSALGTGTWATAIPWNASWDAEVQSEVQDAIEANNLDHLLKNAVDTNFATTVHLDSVIGHIADNGTSATFTRSTDSLEAIRDNQSSSGGASLADIIAGVQSVSGAIVEAQNAAALSIRIGDTWTQDIETLGDLTDKTVTFALKKRASDADTAAIVFITEGTGLTRLNGATTTAGWGSITILDEVAGDIRLRLESDATALLTSGTYVDAVKVMEDGDDRTLRNAGRTVVSAGVIADIT